MGMILLCLLCCMLGGCRAVTLPELPPVTATAPQLKQWQPVVLADTEACYFRIDRCTADGSGNYVVDVVCQNRSDAKAMVSCENWCLDGWQVLSFWGKELLPGEENMFSVIIPYQAPAKSGPDSPQSLSFDLRVFSLGDLEQTYLVSTHAALYPTGEKPGRIPTTELQWQDEAMVLVDNSGCSMVLTDFRQMQDFYEVECLLENKTRQRILYRVYGLQFNGAESEQVWTYELSPGAKCATTMVLELPRAAGHVRGLDMSVYICQSDAWFGRVWAQEDFSLKPRKHS